MMYKIQDYLKQTFFIIVYGFQTCPKGQFNPDIFIARARALKELDPEHSIKLVGFDSSMNEIAFLEAGTLQATLCKSLLTRDI